MDTIVKHTRYHEDFFRAGRVDIDGCEFGARVDFENFGLGAVRTLPEDMHTNSRKYFLRGKVSPIRRNYAFKVNYHIVDLL